MNLISKCVLLTDRCWRYSVPDRCYLLRSAIRDSSGSKVFWIVTFLRLSILTELKQLSGPTCQNGVVHSSISVYSFVVKSCWSVRHTSLITNQHVRKEERCVAIPQVGGCFSDGGINPNLMDIKYTYLFDRYLLVVQIEISWQPVWYTWRGERKYGDNWMLRPGIFTQSRFVRNDWKVQTDEEGLKERRHASVPSNWIRNVNLVVHISSMFPY